MDHNDSIFECYYLPISSTVVRFKCSNCPRSYKHRKHLTHHLKYQCGKTPTLSCPYCPVKFFHKYHLKPHTKRMHRIDFEG
ncbi:hypothetical protein HUJ04_008514 [Dendroctonus ponderosae]|nr:hypothetical protein HUJ04_008514 [Dendroctonus ponderosae]